jgi:hypothetical protein
VAPLALGKQVVTSDFQAFLSLHRLQARISSTYSRLCVQAKLCR